MSAAPPLNLEETLALARMMARIAERDAGEDDGDDEGFWDGWAAGLQQLLAHQRSGVKVTCFLAGSCACHPRLPPPQPEGP